MRILRASVEHLPLVTSLFDAYRVFYEQASDKIGAQKFLKERIQANESVIFLAMLDNEAVGFTQLYTTFSSVSMESFYILNDLFVVPSRRGKGIGQALLQSAKEQCKTMNFKGLALETAKANPAQRLYEKLGWKKDLEHLHYFWICLLYTSPSPRDS